MVFLRKCFGSSGAVAISALHKYLVSVRKYLSNRGPQGSRELKIILLYMPGNGQCNRGPCGRVN